MHRFNAFLLILFISISFPAIAEQTNYVVSYVSTPKSERFKELFSRAYADIGIDITFVEMPVGRRLIELDRGNLDADLGARMRNMEEYDNILSLNLPLAKASIFLICPASTQCTPELLNSQRIDVFMTSGHAEILRSESLLLSTDSVLIRDENSLKMMAEMFANERLNYFVTTVFKGSEMPKLGRDYVSVRLSEIALTHHIHKRHASILDDLKQAILARTKMLTHCEPKRVTEDYC